MAVVFEKTKMLTDTVFHYCPGCNHGIAHRLVAESIEELGLENNVIGVAPVGCAVFAYDYFNCDMFEAAHGRAPAVATGIKRVHPETCVFTYQGDGDLASIGTNEIVHACHRGEKLTVIFINNAIYGMTGGQMAPTTLLGAKTTTTPYGRVESEHGAPMHMCELINQLDAPAYIARVTAADVPNAKKAKAAVKKAFEYQLAGKGFSFVEFVSNCPTNWGMSPLESLDHVHNVILKEFPLGEFRAK